MTLKIKTAYSRFLEVRFEKLFDSHMSNHTRKLSNVKWESFLRVTRYKKSYNGLITFNRLALWCLVLLYQELNLTKNEKVS